MRCPAPITPMRRVSLAPKTRVEASALSPLAMMKLRRFMEVDMASILAERGRQTREPTGKTVENC